MEPGKSRWCCAMPTEIGGQRIGAYKPGRAMLLGRADGDDDAGLALEVFLDELPGFELKLHEITLRLNRREDASVRRSLQVQLLATILAESRLVSMSASALSRASV